MEQPGTSAGQQLLIDAVRHHDLDASVLTDPLEARFRTVARWWSLAGVPVFGVVAIRSGVPGNYVPWQSIASVIALAIAVGGLALAWRWEAAGGAIALVAGVALGALAAVEYHPLLALGAAVLFVVPAVLYLLAWHSTQTLRSIVALTLATFVLMATGGAVAWGFYDSQFGPTHPASSVPVPPASPVAWIWSGGVTHDSAVVVASLPDAGDAAPLLALHADGRPAGEVPGIAAGSEGVFRFDLSGLDAVTTHTYAVVIDGTADDVHTGSFRTFPDGPASFTVAVGSCSRIGSNGAVYDAIRNEDPDLYLVTGDFYYGEIIADDVAEYAAAFDTTLTQPGQAALLAAAPVAYVWDDHDYGPNNAAADSPSRQAALTAYRTFTPHYPLALPGDGAPIAQAFTIGRARFVLTDLRSARDNEAPGGPTMLGPDQLQWLLDEFTAAAGGDSLVIWVSTVPWIAAAEPGADHWGGYAAERQVIAEHVADLDLNLLMLAGDAHMVAIDDGTNSAYAPGEPGFVVMHAAALDRPGSSKGGPFSEGMYPAGGQYAVVTIEDDGGDEIAVTLQGRTWDSTDVVSLQTAYDVEPVR